MPRRPREEIEGGIYHVFARGNNRAPIYLDDVDRRVYLALLEQVARRCRWRCLAYCLMTNHVHLLIETPQANLAAGMQILHGTYAQFFNERHGRSGHVFQGRYGASLMRGEEQLRQTERYIAFNPVTAGLCVQPDEWPWSRRVDEWPPSGRAPEEIGAAGFQPATSPV